MTKTEVKARMTELLPVDLTEAEWAQRAEEMAKVYGQIEETDEKIATAKAAHKERRKVLDEQFTELARQVRTRKEERMVECEERANWDDGRMETWRLDTGEMLRARDMTPQERQRTLDVVALKNS